jgi:lipopolysaccharide cholinephosphotransferase
VEEGAGFSPAQFAKAASATLVKIEARNPFKALYPLFTETPFVVLSVPIEADLLDRVACRYGYRCISLGQRSLAKAIAAVVQLREQTPTRSSQLPYMPPDDADRLYDLMGKVDHLLQRRGIRYWVTAGTLLGAVRHGGLIPWDDDLDICILDQDEDRLKEIEGDLLEVGLAIHHCINSKHCLNFYKIYPLDGSAIDNQDGEERPWKFPFLDIFVMALEKHHEFEDSYAYKSAGLYRSCNKEKYRYAQIEHLSRHPFGPVTVSMPGDPEAFLNAVYGVPDHPDLWKSYAMEPAYSHQREQVLSDGQGTALVEIDDFRPALASVKVGPVRGGE